MSESTVPNYTGFQYHNGKPYYRNLSGNWVEATMAPAQVPQFAPPPGPFQSTVSEARALDQYTQPAPVVDHQFIPAGPVDEEDLDLTHPATIANLRGLKPATKVAGVRQVEKTKKRARSPDSDSDSDAAPPAKRGRPKGTPNFASVDTNKNLDLAEKYKPLGKTAWKKHAHHFNKWAREHNRPERDAKSLEAKYKSLLRTKKPTGSGHCPPEIKRAHRIEQLIAESAGTRQVSDGAASDAVSDNDVSSDDSVEILGAKKASKVHTAVVRRAPTPPPRRNSRLNAPELVTQLAKAFDPEVQQSRDTARAERSFQTTQLLTLNGQLRDSQATIESLCSQITTLQAQVHTAERARDLAEFKLQLADVPKSNPKRRSRQEWMAEYHPDIQRVGGKVRAERVYSDGGRCTTWHSDPSDDEKENRAPYAYPGSSSPFPSSSSSLGPLSSSPMPLLPALPITSSSDTPIAGPSSVAHTAGFDDGTGESSAQ
ncbi:hypothetical protein B0H16DRAFT_1437352 [Mycena metata]|uniref:DUF6818 domain-containing protein n=1 Tax=Mycena metata TaxID=1033252 RepID=A0AAD7H474_9AGAR|nr:hypothetical protein B0H16DRAFT_1437352 [Mycena metata]